MARRRLHLNKPRLGSGMDRNRRHAHGSGRGDKAEGAQGEAVRRIGLLEDGAGGASKVGGGAHRRREGFATTTCTPCVADTRVNRPCLTTGGAVLKAESNGYAGFFRKASSSYITGPFSTMSRMTTSRKMNLSRAVSADGISYLKMSPRRPDSLKLSDRLGKPGRSSSIRDRIQMGRKRRSK